MTDEFARLGDDDAVVAALLAHRMAAAEVAVRLPSARRAIKVAAFDAATEALAARLVEVNAGTAAWRRDLAAELAAARTTDRRRVVLDRAGRWAAALVPTRARQLAVLVELTALPGLDGEWVARARARVLGRVVAELSEVDDADRAHVEHELAVVVRRAGGSDVRRARAGGTGGTGAVGVLDAGVLDAGVGAPGTRAAQALWCATAHEVVRVGVHVRLVTLAEERDDAAAGRVVVLLQRRLDEVTVRLIELATATREAQEAGEALAAELAAERDRARRAEAALVAALPRLRAAVDG